MAGCKCSHSTAADGCRLTLRRHARQLSAEVRQLALAITQQRLLSGCQDALLSRRKAGGRQGAAAACRSRAAAAAQGGEGGSGKVGGCGLHLLQMLQGQH